MFDEMFELILILLSIVGVLACFTPVFMSDTLSEYKKNIRALIILLDQKGYCPQQMENILSFYDSGFLDSD